MIHHNPTSVATAHAPRVLREVGVARGCGFIQVSLGGSSREVVAGGETSRGLGVGEEPVLDFR